MMNNSILQGHKKTADNWLEELNPQEGEVIYEGPPAGECVSVVEYQRRLDREKLEGK